MNLNWFESGLYGFFSGLGDILPVSAQAHRVMMLKIFGVSGAMDLMHFLIRLGIVAALFVHCRQMMTRMYRARMLARIPKRRRKRPLDVRSMMDCSLLFTMLIPVILAFFGYRYLTGLGGSLLWIVAMLFLNGVILYIPQFFPTGNRDSRTLSRVEGLLMGIGGACSLVPGLSGMGAALSVGSLCGVERNYCLNMALLLNIGVNIGLMIQDLLAIIGSGIGEISLLILLRYIMAAVISFGGAFLGIKLMRKMASSNGYAICAMYCLGVSLFAFILNLMA